MDSILTSVKKIIGIDEAYEQFDADIIMHINTVLVTLKQIGIGPEKGFKITSKEETWHDFLGDKLDDYVEVETYLSLKVRLIFDPPNNATAVEVLKETIKEIEYRLYITANPVSTFNQEEE